MPAPLYIFAEYFYFFYKSVVFAVLFIKIVFVLRVFRLTTARSVLYNEIVTNKYPFCEGVATELIMRSVTSQHTDPVIKRKRIKRRSGLF